MTPNGVTFLFFSFRGGGGGFNLCVSKEASERQAYDMLPDAFCT